MASAGIRRALALLSFALLGFSRTAQATDCVPSSGISTCFDADNVWFSAGDSRFFTIASARPLAEKTFASGAAVAFLWRPVELNVLSPDPEGRNIPVVRDVLNLGLAWAYAPTSELELTLATPVTLHQTGSGAEGLTSQSAPPLGRTAVHDPRIGAGYAIPVPSSLERAAGFALKARFELSIPFGDEDIYAGERGFVGAPSLALAMRRDRLYGAAEIGARLRDSVPFASARIGSELVSSIGFGVDILERELLSFGVEAYVLPSLVSQPTRQGNAETVRDGALMPAEWLASVRSAPLPDKAMSLELGGGTGIPLSSDVHEDAAGTRTEHFAGVTTPRFRFLFAVRYTPKAAPKR